MTAAAPTPAPTAPAPVVHPPLPVPQALAYMGAAVMLALSQGLGQGFVSANIPQIAGDLGITTTQASWLMAAYMIPRASLPLLLIKIRTQYGLRRFAEVGIIAYVAVALASVWMQDFRSAVVLQALSGAAAAPLSTPGIRDELALGESQWVFFEAALQRKSDARGLETVATTSERLLEVMDRLTDLYDNALKDALG